MGTIKYDYPPLLAPGRHFMSLPQIEALCVAAFTQKEARARRNRLFLDLEEIIQFLLVKKIRCDVFANGSFFTSKPVPDDVDVIVTVESDIYDGLSPDQMDALDTINTGAIAGNVDATAWVSYPREHKDHGSALDGSTMIEAYGVEHSGEWLKGFAVLRLWEADVGNRLCR
jgi:hypothetical protein